jgi:putative tryptophan/tyrosine transport system substrate-binding protein
VVIAGGLISYGPDPGRIAWPKTTSAASSRAHKRGDVSVQQATKFILTINLKTAESLGITFSTGLLGRADEVIE